MIILSSLPFYLDSNCEIILMRFLKLLLVLQLQAQLYIRVESLSSGILIWRALLQWLGGLGIIVFAIAIIPIFNIGGISYSRKIGVKNLETFTTDQKKLLNY